MSKALKNKIKLSDVVDVKADFGAAGDGVTDDTAAMQAAHNTGSIVYYPAGTYNFTTITIADGGIQGAGFFLTSLHSTDTTSSIKITLNSVVGVWQYGPSYLFQDCRITASDTGNTLIGTALSASGGNGSGATFERIAVQGCGTGFNTDRLYFFNLINCQFSLQTTNNIIVSNTYSVDTGDSVIENCKFNPPTNSGNGVGILWISSGGLRVINNKFLGGDTAIYCNPSLSTPVVSTSDMLFTLNSIENQNVAAIVLGDYSLGYLTNSRIIGNQIFAPSYPYAINIGNGWLSGVCTGNVIAYGTATGTALNLKSGASYWRVAENCIRYCTNGIVVASGATYNRIGGNVYEGVSVSVTVSESTSVVEKITITGSGSVTTGTAYGSFFIGQQNVALPIFFTSAPTVTVNINDDVTGVSLSAKAVGITTTNFYAKVIGLTTGATITYTWSATGIPQI